MKLKLLFLSCSLLLLITACKKKSDTPASSSLVGTWKFLSTGGTTISTSEMNFAGDFLKIEAILNYTSSNPKGTYKISSSSMDAAGVGYDYSGSLILKSYENNILQSSNTTVLPPTTYPPISNSTGYKAVGADSIAFTTNPPFVQLPNGGTMTSPGGCKYKLEGNKLTMFLKHNSSTTGSSGGISTVDKQKIDVTLVLERQ